MKRGRPRQQGATMSEVLIALMVVAIGLLGANAMQLAATRFQTTALHRATAMQHGRALIERMRVNPWAMQPSAVAPWPADLAGQYLAADAYADARRLPDAKACGQTGQPRCSAQDTASNDVRQWRESLANALPRGRGAIFPLDTSSASVGPGRLVVVMWREKPELAPAGDGATAESTPVDPGCPEPREAGIRCFGLVALP